MFKIGKNSTRFVQSVATPRLSSRPVPSSGSRNASTLENQVSNRIRVSALHRNHFIFGANTDVGKTVITAGLTKTSLDTSDSLNVHYIKPLQCGGSDEAFVDKYAKSSSNYHLNFDQQTLFSWDLPASPHTASRMEASPTSDQEVLDSIHLSLANITTTKKSVTWIETAGGVLSPSSASPENNFAYHSRGENKVGTDDDINIHWGWTTQADLYQPLAELSSTVLVGDGRLGGISATLSSLESLLLRGYSIAGIVLLDTGYDNVTALREYTSRNLKFLSRDGTPLFSDPERSIICLPELPPLPEPLEEWYESSQVKETLISFNESLDQAWLTKMDHLQSLQQHISGKDGCWWAPVRSDTVDEEASPLTSLAENTRLSNMQKRAIERLEHNP